MQSFKQFITEGRVWKLSYHTSAPEKIAAIFRKAGYHVDTQSGKLILHAPDAGDGWGALGAWRDALKNSGIVDILDFNDVVGVVNEDRTSFEPRVRFNWGFWDGVSDAKNKRTAMWSKNGKSHYDKAYEAGYWEGRADADTNPSTSDAAWQRVKAKTAKPSNDRPMFPTRY